MTTPSEYATDAASTLHQILRTSPRGFDAEGAAAVIEQAIRNATRERESNARRQLTKVQSAAAEVEHAKIAAVQLDLQPHYAGRKSLL
jgi:adenylate cyclase